MKQEIVESGQIAGTASENIKHYLIEGNKTTAVFYSYKNMVEYVKKYSLFAFSENWYDRVGFADFQIEGNTIRAYSTYHPASSLINMFEKGLKNIY